MSAQLWAGIAGILLVALCTRAAGPVLGPSSMGPRALSVISLLAPALLAGLVLVDVAGRSWHALDGAVVLGLLAATGLRLRYGGVVGPLVCAAVVTALVRLV